MAALNQGGDLVGVQLLVLNKSLGKRVQDVDVCGKDGLGAFVAVVHEPLHFFINCNGRDFAVVLVLGDLTPKENLFFLYPKGKRTHTVTHAPLTDHLAGQFSCPFDIVAGTCGRVLENQLFRRSAAHVDVKIVDQVFPRIGVFFLHRKLLGNTQGHPAGNNRHLVNGISARKKLGHQRVAGLVVRGDFLFFVTDDHAAALGAHHDLVLGAFKVPHIHLDLVLPGSEKRRFVGQIGQVGTRKSGRAARQDRQIDIVGQRDVLGVNGQDAGAAAHIRA